jgi:hypothetical protein
MRECLHADCRIQSGGPRFIAVCGHADCARMFDPLGALQAMCVDSIWGVRKEAPALTEPKVWRYCGSERDHVFFDVSEMLQVSFVDMVSHALSLFYVSGAAHDVMEWALGVRAGLGRLGREDFVIFCFIFWFTFFVLFFIGFVLAALFIFIAI